MRLTQQNESGSATPDERKFSVRYEVHRERERGRAGVVPPPTIEIFLGLDRARLSALSNALNGPSHTGYKYSGTVRVFEIFYRGSCEFKRALVDVIDERVASRVLNEVRLPRANQLSVSMESLQEEFNDLLL